MNQQQATAGDAQLPQVIASYATFLRARTRTAPQTTITGHRAEMSLTVGGKTLRLTFRYGQRGWSVARTELRQGERTTAFAPGRVLDAVAALMR